MPEIDVALAPPPRAKSDLNAFVNGGGSGRARGVVERATGTKVRRTVYFSEVVGRKLAAYSGEHGLDMSEIANEAVLEWLRARGVDV